MQYIIATHGTLAKGYAETVELLLHETVHPICAYADGSEDFPASLTALLDSFGPDEPVLVFTDLVHGSVCQNIAGLCAQYPHMQVAAGVSLPLVMECVLPGAPMTRAELAQAIADACAEMTDVNALLGL